VVYHVLKDGRRPTDITGHVVRLKDAEPLYQLIHKINHKKIKQKKR
jgi:hypothetical protein